MPFMAVWCRRFRSQPSLEASGAARAFHARNVRGPQHKPSLTAMSAQVSFTVLLDNYIEASAQIAIRDQLQTAQDELKAGGGGGGGGGQQVPVVAFKTNITHSVAHRLARHILQGRRGVFDARPLPWRLGCFSAFDSPLCWGGP